MIVCIRAQLNPEDGGTLAWKRVLCNNHPLQNSGHTGEEEAGGQKTGKGPFSRHSTASNHELTATAVTRTGPAQDWPCQQSFEYGGWAHEGPTLPPNCWLLISCEEGTTVFSCIPTVSAHQSPMVGSKLIRMALP